MVYGLISGLNTFIRLNILPPSLDLFIHVQSELPTERKDQRLICLCNIGGGMVSHLRFKMHVLSVCDLETQHTVLGASHHILIQAWGK